MLKIILKDTERLQRGAGRPIEVRALVRQARPREWSDPPVDVALVFLDATLVQMAGEETRLVRA